MVNIAEFGRLFGQVNGEKGQNFRSWNFKPGMEYGDPLFWWSTTGKKRPRPHEGIDFFCYEDGQGKKYELTRCLVPTPCDAKVIALCPDFLGISVFLLAKQEWGQADIVVLAHICSHVEKGQILKKGDVVGEVPPVRQGVPAHLHVSFLQGDWHDLPLKLSWPALLSQYKLRFVRPF